MSPKLPLALLRRPLAMWLAVLIAVLRTLAPPPPSLGHLFVMLADPQGRTIRQANFYFTPLVLRPPPRGPPASPELSNS